MNIVLNDIVQFFETNIIVDANFLFLKKYAFDTPHHRTEHSRENDFIRKFMRKIYFVL